MTADTATFNPTPLKLLVLDLDETLLHATDTPLARDEDFCVGPYSVYLRPGVSEFIAHVLARHHVGVWTSSGEDYAAEIVARLFPPDALQFVWSANRCTTMRDFETDRYVGTKRLDKLKRRGWRLEHVIMVDDSPEKHLRNYGNLVRVRAFEGDPHDDELAHLARYLDHLAREPDVRRVEKRRWRERLLAGGVL